MTDKMTFKIGSRLIGRRGLVCTLCHVSLTSKEVHRIPPPESSEFHGVREVIMVCSVCKDGGK